MLKRTLLLISLRSRLLINDQDINKTNETTKISGKIGININIPTRTN